MTAERGSSRTLLLAIPLVFLIGASLVRPSRGATVKLVPVTASNYRWRDIATNLYSAAYRDTYTYYDADVTVAFDLCPDSSFTGSLEADNLKPNFAYQMKIIGKPEGIWGPAGDDLTNERIGYAGRWWRVQPDPGNADDQDYEAHKNDPEYIYEGYLVFDFFVTGRFGEADFDFASTSSYHVLWWEQQRPRGSCDSPVEWSTVIGHAGDQAYDGDVGPTEVGVYGEIERLCYGETHLEPGVYNCRFGLTEESFHQSGDGEGGWATVLMCDTLVFEVACGAGVGRGAESFSPALERVSPNPFRDEVALDFRLSRPGPVSLKIYGVEGRLILSLQSRPLAAGAHRLIWDGRDARGRRAAEGLYLYKLEAVSGDGIAGKVLLLR